MGYREEQEIMNQEVKVDCPGGGSAKRCKMKDVINSSKISTYVNILQTADITVKR